MASSKSRVTIVLNVKKHQEKKVQNELGEISRSRVREGTRLEEMRNTNDDAMTRAGKLEKCRATDLQAGRAFIRELSHKITEQQKKLQSIETQEVAKRQELVEKSKEKKIVEKLQEKRHAEEVKELEKKHQNLIDVLAQRTRREF